MSNVVNKIDMPKRYLDEQRYDVLARCLSILFYGVGLKYSIKSRLNKESDRIEFDLVEEQDE